MKRERKSMKMRWNKVVLAMVVLMSLMFLAPMEASAGEVTSGTIGDNGGLQWTYDEETKTLVLTGEDVLTGKEMLKSPLHDLGYKIISNVEKIILRDCTLVGSCNYAFNGLRSLKHIECENVDTSQVTNMSEMFIDCESLLSLDLSGFDTSQVTNMSEMFSDCKSLLSLDLSGFDTSQVTDMGSMFFRCNSLSSLDLSGFDTSQVTDMGSMFFGCNSLSSLDLSGFDTSQVTNMSEMFAGCSGLSSLDLSHFDTAQVTYMQGMFRACSSLLSLDLSHFDTSQVTSMGDGVVYSGGMFQGCSSLSSLDLSGFDTSQVTEMRNMFRECSSLSNIDLSHFDTAQVTYMPGMFRGCSSLLSLDLSHFDTSQVTSMGDVYSGGMFQGCSSLSSLDLSGFDTSQVTEMRNMFRECSSLSNIDLSSFDTARVGDMESMFQECSSLSNIDLSHFKTARVRYFESMFCDCSSLQSLNLSNFDMTNASGSNWIAMLQNCMSLNVIHTPKMMAGTWFYLPGTFYDEEGNHYTDVGLNNCEKTLIRGLDHYTITYHLNGGLHNGGNPITYTVATETITLKDAFREGHTFEGWYSDNDFTTKVTQIVKGSTGNKVFYAKWKAIAENQEGIVKAFVERMYTVALGRSADPEGVEFWTNQLLTHATDGAALSEGFILSDEFVKKNYSDTDYLKVLYKTFFNRDADEGGIAYWINEMNSGKSRRTILAGFVNSNEFDSLCFQYGIERGFMGLEPIPDSGVQGFVERLYTICLERASEPAGLADWTRRIEAGEISPLEVAKFFFLSEEYEEKRTSNDKYIENLYLVFMDRASDAEGKAYWVHELETGNRRIVLERFGQSKEFQEIMERYGL